MTDKMLKAVSLLPCPFCGTPDPEYDNCDYGSGQWYSCRGCPVIVKVPYREDLVKAWNTRAMQPFIRQEWRPIEEMPDGAIGLCTADSRADAEVCINDNNGDYIKMQGYKWWFDVPPLPTTPKETNPKE